MNNPFLHRLIKEKKSDVVHSSAYAKMQNSNSVGVASTQSFAERQKIEHGRRFVRRYGDSKLTNEFGRLSWQSRKNAQQTNNTQNGTPEIDKSLGTRNGSIGRSSPSAGTGPARMPSRKNPGISR